MTDLEILLIKDQIREQLATYCNGMDLCDHELSYSVFTKDAVCDYGPMMGGPKGPKEIVDQILRSHLNHLNSMHRSCNVVIVVDSETTARSSCYTMSTLWKGGDPEKGTKDNISVSWVRQSDEWKLEDGKWRISHRIAKMMLMNNYPVNIGFDLKFEPRDKSNHFYAILPEYDL